ncbi:MAG: IPT/TIG domain-containing protein [Myxococcota bacterium]
MNTFNADLKAMCSSGTRRVCPSRLLSILVLALMLLAGACSDDTNDNNGATDTGDVDQTQDAGDDGGSDSTTSDTDSEDTRRPSDTDNEWDFGTPDGDEVQEQPFEIQTIIPGSGPVEGGNLVRIRGQALDEDVTIYLGSREMDVDLSSGQLVGYAPPAGGPGTVTVKAISSSGEVSTIPDGYRYVEGLKIESVTPNRIPTEGGVQVDIRGSGFTEDAAVSFSGTPALRVTPVDENLVRALAPPRRRGYADVRVTTRQDSTVLERGVEYYESLDITSIRPGTSPVSGGVEVEIQGTGFRSQMTFEFGGEPASVSAVDSRNGTATVRTPAHPVGLVDVTASTATDTAIASDAFYYRDSDDPQLVAVEPEFGSAAGGEGVVLVGYGFDLANLRVTFGGSDATIIEKESGYALVETPAGTPGLVDVAMHDGNTELDRLADAFEYREGIWIDAVEPSEGPVAGGTAVKVEGTGLSNATRVEFGGVPADFSVVSDTELKVTTPAHGAGTVDVTASANGLEARLQDGFTYTEPLELWGFDPVRGAAAGGTYIEMRGRGFYGAIEVLFDAEEAPTVQRVDRNNLIVYSPPHPVGEAVVSVEADARSAEGPYTYQYYNPASRFGGASGGEVDGSVNISVFSRGGGPIPNAFAMLSTRGDTRYQGTTDQNGQITLSGPDVLGPQTVTATAAGFSSATVQSVDATNITVFLNQLDPNPSGGGGGNGTPFGTISGDVTAPSKMSDPDKSTTFDLARVATTRPGPFTGTLDPGTGGEVIGNGSYSIRSRVGDVAVVAVCGVYDESDGSFDPQFIGVERYIFVSDQGQYDVDLVCDIPLDRTADVKIDNPAYAPTGPDTNRARVFWDFGFEGVFPAPVEATGLENVLSVPRQPASEGMLDDLTYTVIGGSFTGQYAPFTQTWVEEIPSLDETIVLPPLLDVPEPDSPQPGGLVENQTIRFQAAGPYYPDLYSVLLLNSEGIPFWQIILPGTSETVRLPEFPDFSFLPEDQRPDPYGSEQAFMTIIGIRGDGIRFDEFSYQDLTFDSWSAYSLNRWSVRFPAEDGQ